MGGDFMRYRWKCGIQFPGLCQHDFTGTRDALKVGQGSFFYVIQWYSISSLVHDARILEMVSGRPVQRVELLRSRR